MSASITYTCDACGEQEIKPKSYTAAIETFEIKMVSRQHHTETMIANADLCPNCQKAVMVQVRNLVNAQRLKAQK